ncbi:thioredoxin domain-containing protein [Leucobacter sp. USCH14]|uniref:thioredoxin domain-containing protein n=1 Tax=Leucobacter sp. USCH14 TaxID=3024838 RepID=UPI0030ABEFA2
MTDPQQPASPPPHPFAATSPVPGRRASGAVSTAAMALGLGAVVTVVVSAFYFGYGAILGALLGIAAVVLGILGLVSRRRRAPAIAGLVAGVLALLGALALGVFSVVTLAGAVADHVRPGAPGAVGDEPRAEAQIVWPENMATGGIVFDQDGVVRSEVPASGAPEVPEVGSAAHSVRVYVDYRCPYCSEFETANGETLERLAASGRATVEIIPLAFLDRVSPDAYSSRASGAMACVADAQPDAAWEVHRHLFDPAVQPSETTNGLDNEALIDAVDEASGGANEEVRSCIESERFVPFAQSLNSWVFDHPVPGAQDPELRVTSTPFAVVDGVPYAGAPDDAQGFSDFLAQQGAAVGSVS